MCLTLSCLYVKKTEYSTRANDKQSNVFQKHLISKPDFDPFICFSKIYFLTKFSVRMTRNTGNVCQVSYSTWTNPWIIRVKYANISLQQAEVIQQDRIFRRDRTLWSCDHMPQIARQAACPYVLGRPWQVVV